MLKKAATAKTIEKKVTRPRKPKTASVTSTKTVKFQLTAPHAKTVYLVGEFNGWGTEVNPLKFEKKTGSWKTSLKLEPGRYLYKFIVDGEWWSDPSNAAWEWNEYGSHNSILTIE